MADRRAGAGAFVALMLLVAPPLAGSAAGRSLSGSFVGGGSFPERSIVLSVPSRYPISARQLTVTENGGPVSGVTLTQLTRANAGDVGVELVIDRSETMRGAAIARAMSAARALADQRGREQRLGVITFASAARVALPLTDDARAVTNALSMPPQISAGARLLAAVMLALDRLKAGHFAGSAVVLLSDGAATAQHGLTPRAVAAAAQAQGSVVYAVGVRSGSYRPGTMRTLADRGGGKLVPASGAPAPVFRAAARSLARSYLVSYRSSVSGGGGVSVTLRVRGVPGDLGLTYSAPAPPKPVTAPPSTTAAPPSTTAAPPSTTAARFSAAAAPTNPSSAGAAHPPGRAGPNASRPSSKLVPAPPSPVRGEPYRPISGTPRPVVGSPALAQAGSAHAAAVSAPVPPAAASPRGTFWTSSESVLAVGGACALLAGLAIALLLRVRGDRHGVRQRVAQFFAVAAAGMEQPGETTGPEGLLERLLSGRRWWPRFVERVNAARMRRSPITLVKRWLLASSLTAVVVAGVSGAVVLGLLVLVATPFVLRAALTHFAGRQRIRFAEQLPTNLQDLAGAMRTGRSLIGAMAMVAETSAEPMRGELERAVTDERLGLPLDAALEAIAERMGATDMGQVALVAALHRSSGSNVGEALDRVAEAARERADLQGEMRALTSQARLSSWVLTALPPSMLVALSFIAPSYERPLFHTAGGIAMLVISTGMLLAGWQVMNRIVRPES